MFRMKSWGDYRVMLSNFSYLSILEILGLLFPLLTYPYLIRILGKNTYGAVVMAQTIAAYLVIIVNFGFNVSATKDVSENRNNSISLSNIVSSVFFLKTIIFLLTAVCYVTAVLFIVEDKYKLLYLFSLGLCIQEIYFPTWFFQGIENMKYITIISFFTRCVFLLLIFVVIKSDNDFIYIPLINSFGGLIASIISIYILVKYFSIKVKKVPFQYIKLIYMRSIPFFFSRFASVAMEKTNAVLVGTVLSYGDLAVYDLGTKIVGLLRIPFNLIAQVLYPSVTRSKDIGIIRKTMFFSVGLSLIIVIVMWFITPYVVVFLGGLQLQESTKIVYLLDLVLPAVAVGCILGASTLVTFGRIKEYNLSVIYTFIMYLLVVVFLFVFNKLNLYGVACAYILPEYGVCLYRYWVVRRYIYPLVKN